MPFTCHCHLYPFTALVSSGVVRWPALTLVHTNSAFDKGLCLTQQWWWGHNATAFRALRTAASGAAGMPLVHCSRAGPMGYQRSQSSSWPWCNHYSTATITTWPPPLPAHKIKVAIFGRPIKYHLPGIDLSHPSSQTVLKSEWHLHGHQTPYQSDITSMPLGLGDETIAIIIAI